MDKNKVPNCLRCEHFFVTWDPAFPRGCRIFGIKSRSLPSMEVRKATGRQCPSFKESARLKKQ
ncbi:MAG: uracil-DNA glycosylase [Spirochaetaceae bacterium 4572_59]|nr:MAG: uracil-DNA glycosylase [Spirochaetaceae bacterium 4572_59]